MTDTLTHDVLRAQLDDLRAQATTPPAKIELGKSQRAAIEAYVREQTGEADVGPILSFYGLEVVNSRRDDHLRLLATDEQGEDVEVEIPEPMPIEPVPPAQEPAESG